jgi:hypothetical protein
VGDRFRLHPDVALAVAHVQRSWAFVLTERNDGTTRLLVRERYRYTRRWAPLLVEPVQAFSFVMTQKMLRGIRDRSEATRPERPRCGD